MIRAHLSERNKQACLKSHLAIVWGITERNEPLGQRTRKNHTYIRAGMLKMVYSSQHTTNVTRFGMMVHTAINLIVSIVPHNRSRYPNDKGTERRENRS